MVSHLGPPRIRTCGTTASGSPPSFLLRTAPTSCRPSRRASLPSFGDTALCRLFAPGDVGLLFRARVLWVVASPTTLLMAETTGSPEFPGNPMYTCPALRPRRDPPGRPLRPSDSAFHHYDGVGSRVLPLSRLYHTACGLPVYASQPGLPQHHATLGSGYWPALPGGIGYPLGSTARFQLRLVRSSLPPCPSFARRTIITVQTFCSASFSPTSSPMLPPWPKVA